MPNVIVSFSPTDTVPSKPLLFGSNIQWCDRGDGMISPNSTEFDPIMLDLAKRLRPKLLRYPGGTESDCFHYRSALGPLAGRTPISRANPQAEKQIPAFGTDEFLRLCKTLGATPFMTANIVTAGDAENASWLAYCKSLGIACPYWELGNESYIPHDGRPDLDLTPEQYVARVVPIIAALRKIDKSVKIGIILRTAFLNGFQTTPFTRWNDVALAGVKDFDFASIHTAYLPYVTGWPSNEQIFLSAMAASKTAIDDVQTTFDRVRKINPKAEVCVSEFGPLFTAGGSLDSYAASMTGALYVADLIRALYVDSPATMAAHWALSGNSWWGSITNDRQPRTLYRVFSKIADVLDRPVVRTTTTNSPTLDTPSVGAVAARKNVPAVTAFISSGDDVRALIVNKNPAKEAVVSLRCAGGNLKKVSILESLTLAAADPFSSAPTDWSQTVRAFETVDGVDYPVLVVPAAGMGYVRFRRK